MKFITKEGLQELKDWKYKCSTYTWGDNAMQLYWNWFVTLFPTVSFVKLNLIPDNVVGRPEFDNSDGHYVDVVQYTSLGGL